MRLRVLIGLFSTGWAWLKGVLAKMATPSPRGIFFAIHKKSHRGGEFNLVFSTHDPETAARLLKGSPVPLLKQLPGAVGGDCSAPPHVPANPELLPAQLAYFY